MASEVRVTYLRLYKLLPYYNAASLLYFKSNTLFEKINTVWNKRNNGLCAHPLVLMLKNCL